MITFKKIKLEDIEFLNNIRNECRDYLHNNLYFTLEETLDWFKKTYPDFYIIYYNEIKIGYFRTSNLIKNESIYIGCDIHKDYRNKGIGILSYKEFIPYIMKKYNLKKIKLEVLSTNERAIHLYLKLGFKIINKQYNYMIRNNKNIDNIIMEYEKL